MFIFDKLLYIARLHSHMDMSFAQPYSQPSSFIDLLNSQQDPSPLDESYDHVPVPSSQSTAKSRSERRTWTPSDDIFLISAWLNTSKDPLVGNEQKCGAFWKRISAYFAASSKSPNPENREASNCKQRWHRINDQVSKFCGAYEAATREKTSGQNENDVLKQAHQIFYNNHNKKFTLEHAWMELRHDQKWCALSTSKAGASSKKRKTEECSDANVTGDDSVSSTRPAGVKSVKARGKKDSVQANKLTEIQLVWEIKEKDNAMKERLSKMNLLDSLITKKEPLTEIEEGLKQKLIADMFA